MSTDDPGVNDIMIATLRDLNIAHRSHFAEPVIPGEEATGFVHGNDRGPFQCSNCVYMEHDSDGCLHPIMIDLSHLPRNPRGLPIVGKKDHCVFVRRPRS